MPALPFPIVIFAGGLGARIGGDKPDRLLGGRSLLDRSIAYARRHSDRVVVATGVDRDIAGVATVLDRPDIEGPLAALAAGLDFARAHGANAVLTIACDMPFLPQNLGQRLADGARSAHATIASQGGRLHPVCGFWRLGAANGLRSYLDTGKRSLHGFAAHVGYRRCAWPEESDAFFNINDEAALHEAERRLAPDDQLTVTTPPATRIISPQIHAPAREDS